MTSGDVWDNVDMDPLLAEHRAALSELRENLDRLRKLIDREEDLGWAVLDATPIQVGAL